MKNKKKSITAKNKELRSKQTIPTLLKNNKATILPVIVVFCLPVLLYLQTVGFGFIGFDDKEVITKNIAFLSDLGNIPQAFLKDAFIGKSSHFYRPVQTLSYMTDIFLSGGNNIWMYHLTHVLLIGIISCLLFLLLRKFLIPLKLALIGTLIFSAHPLFIPLITWIPARGDLLLVLFSLLSFLFFMEHLQKKKLIYLFLHWLAFTIALFCKETAALLVFLFMMYYFIFSFGKRFEKKYLLNIALYAVSGIVWFWLRSIATGNPTNQNDVGLTILISNLRTIPESLARFFLPFGSTFISSFSLFYTLTGMGIIIAIIVIFLTNKERTKKEKIFCISWFVFLMLPAMIIKEEYIDYLSHRLFLPLTGILLFVLFSLPKKWLTEKNAKEKIIINGCCFFIIAILSVLTFINSRPYSDSINFYDSYISRNPDNRNNVLIYTNRGNEKYINSDFIGAIEDFTKAIELNPDFAIGYNDRGTAYAAQGELLQAIEDYDRAIALVPNYFEAYNNRGKAYADMGNNDQAAKDYNKAIGLNPNFADAYNEQGTAFAAKGDPDNAIKHYSKAIELNPYYAEAYNNLGLAYHATGDIMRAIKNFDKAIELKPDLSEAYYNLGNSYSAKADPDNAIKNYIKAIELNPDYAEAYNNLGLAYQDKGDLESAVKGYNKSIQLKPNLAEAYFNRGNSYLIKGNFDNAIKDYDKAIALRPGYAEAYGIRGIAYSEKGDIDSAIENYKKAIEFNPGDANAYGNLGNAYKTKGRLKEAAQAFSMYEKLIQTR